MNDNASFKTLELGSSQPTSVPTEVIVVEISKDNLMGGYGKAFVQEAYRVNPLRAEQIKLTPEEVEEYCNFLLTKRINSVHLNCPEFRKLKALYVPAWIEYNLQLIGRVDMYDIGLTIMPEIAEPSNMSFEEAVVISDKIGQLIDDLQIVQDAMPRDIHGDVNVMSTAMIAGYVRAIRKVDHVSFTYATRFLGLKLREEAAMRALYRVQYDDVNFIASVLTTQKGLY